VRGGANRPERLVVIHAHRAHEADGSEGSVHQPVAGADERAFVRVGQELEHPALREIALVGACYGLVHRALGAVSLVGPVRMDYDKALRAVRSAALELSRFAESVFED
jgi:transcriptional regulator of heat shock response